MADNIILTGMAAAGKSTVGVLLAKHTGRDFIDTDVLIQVQRGRTLQEIVDDEGYLALREYEARVLLGLQCENTVIATGGSAVYSHAAMQHLHGIGTVVLLRASFDTIRERVTNLDSRGLARRADQSLEDLYREREPLYERDADVIIDVDRLPAETVCERIIAAVTDR